MPGPGPRAAEPDPVHIRRTAEAGPCFRPAHLVATRGARPVTGGGVGPISAHSIRVALRLALVVATAAGRADPGPPAKAPGLRVLSYNVHHAEGTDGKLDLDRVAKVISAPLRPNSFLGPGQPMGPRPGRERTEGTSSAASAR